MTIGERSALANLPTAVYRFYDSDDQLLYVGMTHNVEERWAAHERNQPWWLDVARREFTWHDSRAAAEEIEASATTAEKPKYDRSGNRGTGEVEQRLEVESERAKAAVRADIDNGTYPRWRFLPGYPELSKRYEIPMIGIARGLLRLVSHDRVLVYHHDQFAVSRPGCTPSRDAQKIGLLYFLTSNAFGGSSFTLSDLADMTGASRASAAQHVKRWQEADRVECLGRVPKGRSLIYRIIRHPEPDGPQVLPYWRSDDVLALAQWLNHQLDADAAAAGDDCDRDRAIIDACLPNEYGVSQGGVRVLKVMAHRYRERSGCRPEWGID